MTACTSNMISRHQGPKQKLRASYRVPSQHPRPICRHSYFCLYWTSPVSVTHVIFFIVECDIACFVCAMRALCVYLTFGYHPHP